LADIQLGPPPGGPQAPEPQWRVVSGTCAARGECVESPQYPQAYRNNQACTIEAPTFEFEVKDFSTENYFDKLYIDGVALSGTDTIYTNSLYTASKSISWQSDYSVTNKGWQLCRRNSSNSDDNYGMIGGSLVDIAEVSADVDAVWVPFHLR
jgi:hypothetical protein